MTQNSMQELDIEHSKNFQTRWYKIERVIFVILLLIVVAALSGKLGDDQNDSAIFSPDGSIKLTFSSLARYSATSKIEIDEIRLSDRLDFKVGFSRLFLDEIDITGVSPTPTYMTTDANGTIYHFDPEKIAGGRLEFKVRNLQFGLSHGTIMMQGVTYPVNRLVLP